MDVKQVGRELGVRYVLEGSVRKAATGCASRRSSSMPGPGPPLGRQVRRPLDDVFDLHDQVAREVAGAVEPNLREAEINRSLRKPTTSLDAYDLYMRGLAAFRYLSIDSLRVALELTRRAIDLDPRFARALALRGLCIQHLQAGKAEDPEAMAEALGLAHSALPRRATTGKRQPSLPR